MPDRRSKQRSKYTLDRGIPGAFEGETVTRRRFMVVGANALLAYVLDPLVYPLSRKVMWDAFPDWSSPSIKLYAAIIELGVLWLILWLLYRRRIFIRA